MSTLLTSHLIGKALIKLVSRGYSSRHDLMELVLCCEPHNDQVNIPNASNACSGFDNSFGWSFFDLNAIHDDHKDSTETVLQADFVSIYPPAFLLIL